MDAPAPAAAVPGPLASVVIVVGGMVTAEVRVESSVDSLVCVVTSVDTPAQEVFESFWVTVAVTMWLATTVAVTVLLATIGNPVAPHDACEFGAV